MGFTGEFVTLPLEELRRQAAVMKADGYRFMQTHAVNNDDGVDLYYSFMKDGKALNYRIEGVKPEQEVPSITDLFLAAFVFENEARELFGVNMTEIAIDFHGAMYAPSAESPMTFISPEQKAAKEKARKAAAAKAAKNESASSAGGEGAVGSPAGTGQAVKRVFVMTPELQARLDAKMPTLSPEKREKVEAALKARAAEAAASGTGDAAASPASGSEQQPSVAKGKPSETSDAPAAGSIGAPTERDDELDELLGNMDAEKAARVKAAIEGRHASDEGSPNASAEASGSPGHADGQVEALLNMMGEAKAAKVIAALSNEEGK